MRMERNYSAFLQDIGRFIPRDRLFTDELHRLAWGTDAGFYRLIPQIVIHSINDDEVIEIIYLADRYNIPVTFRAAGTSLSGQAISDSVLIIAGKGWENYELSPDHEKIYLEPGIVGQRVNEILAPYGRKFAPDPASIKSAMVGGIVMNNASGMNCGTHANSDKMLLSVHIIFPDGYYLNTDSQESRENFKEDYPEFLQRICELRDQIRSNEKLSARIRHKYSIKNVTGLNILPFLVYDDPFDIIAHLMVGSEGTLAFLAGVTMKTEYDYPYKASAMLYFSDIKEACRAVVAMKRLVNANGEWIVKGAELLDWKSLASVNDPTGEGLTAVLTETKACTQEELNQNIAIIEEALKAFDTYIPVHFTDQPEEYSKYWAIRAGIFPSVGGTRPSGTTCLIEDVAFHIEDLPEATAELQQLIARHGYDDACIYGHALEGNYHFIINQSFSSEAEVKRYEALMNDVIDLVVGKYDGSLKAEHGTGRNMAPFVEYEWGEEAYAIMKEVKQLFDPKGLFNPGVIFNDDPQCHIKHFKPLSPLTIGQITRKMHSAWGLPQWTPAMPKSYKIRKSDQTPAMNNKVVYFPSCINQTMGLAKDSPVDQPLVKQMLSLLQKAGYEVIFPPKMEKLCCGTIWESKGMLDIADSKSTELEAALWEASEQGRYPVLCDQSPCLHRMRATIQKIKLYEPAEFIYTFLRDKLEFTPTDRPIAIHITCSMRKMGLANILISLAKLCSTQVFIPEEVGCCGFAGDKGFTQPELNTYALRKLRPQLTKAGIGIGYSNSRTCEIGLATNTGIPYVSIAYLVDQCTRPIKQKNNLTLK